MRLSLGQDAGAPLRRTQAHACVLPNPPARRCSETWPFFRPNFSNLEAYRQQYGAEEVVGFVPTGWLFEMKKTPYSGPSFIVLC